MYVWHARHRRLLRVLSGHTDVVSSVAWNAALPGVRCGELHCPSAPSGVIAASRPSVRAWRGGPEGCRAGDGRGKGSRAADVLGPPPPRPRAALPRAAFLGGAEPTVGAEPTRARPCEDGMASAVLVGRGGVGTSALHSRLWPSIWAGVRSRLHTGHGDGELRGVAGPLQLRRCTSSLPGRNVRAQCGHASITSDS